ncbi:AsnC family transcriptional regulator [Arthrobacter sp. MYb227]|uniref:Lrp/AsnC family transcriptional regulator n=1 Tax=Arthrobacter sp. MYb227 TaxID=1848601 RepID=UPI000CFDBEFA|nr:Lrp/AsnC family transcriptional regulator [Arthrobacter sp. MYb227]PQZ89032.1 AsnC family transcriptional regulator [Arthrobacter sp. MYb227]
MRIDALDVSLIELLTDEPGLGVMECSKRLGVARGTVQNRLNRLHESGVISRIAPQIGPSAMGYPVITFCSLQIKQNFGQTEVAAELAKIPEILEMHTVSGTSDMLVKIVARSTKDLQRVLDAISATEGMSRSSSSIVLETHFENRTIPLAWEAVRKNSADLAEPATAPRESTLRNGGRLGAATNAGHTA